MEALSVLSMLDFYGEWFRAVGLGKNRLTNERATLADIPLRNDQSP